jgi:4-amino-4-deoxy-L-arabinose transferase-like glycosyltransferase
MLDKVLNSRLFFFTESRETKMLVLIGAIYRVLMFSVYLHSNIFPDSYGFITLGDWMRDFDLYGYNGERSPGYPALYFLLFGSTRLTVILQFGIGIATSVYWYKMLLNLKFNSRNSFWIALFLQSFLTVFLYESSFLIETLALFLISLIFYILTDNYFEKKSLKLELLMSFLLGYLVLVKPFFAFIPFIIYGFVILKEFRISNFLNQKIIILIFPMIAYFGWSYVNKLNTGYFVSTTFYGLNIAQNCVYFAEKCPEEYQWIGDSYAKHREISIKENEDVAMTIWRSYASGDFDDKCLNFAQLSNELGNYGKATIANNPKDYVEQVFTRSWFDFWLVFGKKEFTPFRITFVDKTMDGIWFVQNIMLLLFKFSFLALTPFYIFKFLRERKVTIEIIIVTVVFATSLLQGLVTYGTNSKYAFPFEFLMVILCLLFIKNHVRFSKPLNRILQ